MKTIFDTRACAVLYNLLSSQKDERPFLLPANICPIIPITFLQANRRFRFVDIAEPDLVMNKDQCLELIRKNRNVFAGLLFVRTYGVEDDEASFFNELKATQDDLLIVDDKCLCPPDCEGSGLDDVADVTLYSTNAKKYVDLGSGGFAHLKDHINYERSLGPYSVDDLNLLISRYKKCYSERQRFQLNGEAWLDLSGMSQAWSTYRTRVLDGRKRANEKKERINAIYAQGLPCGIQLPEKFQRWRFNIRVPSGEQLVSRLLSLGLFASRHYSSVTGVFSDDSFIQSDRLHGEVVNLFNDFYYDDGMAQRTVQIILDHISRI
jgi:hypothetical protein